MEAKSPTLQRLYRDWEDWRGPRRFPTRDDIDPVKLRYILGNLSLVDVFYDPLRFFFRVHGTESVERAGRDLTGKFLDELPNASLRNIIHTNLARTIEKRAPLSVFHERLVATRVFGYLEVLVLPFSSDQEMIDTLAIGAHFDVPPRYWERVPGAPAAKP